MWILFKLLVAGGAFFLRLYLDWAMGRAGGTVHFSIGRANLLFLLYSHKDIQRTWVGLPLRSRTHFRLTEESWADRLFVRLGFAIEFQTGDLDFDRRFYIASDCSAFHRALQADPEARRQITQLFGYDGLRLSYDGATLWLKCRGDRGTERIEIGKRLIALGKLIEQIDKAHSTWSHPFGNIKVILVESLVWSVAAWAVTNSVAFGFFREDVHLDPWQIFRDGIGLALTLAAGFCVGVFLWLGRSSRTHRVLVESIVVLGLSLPVLGPSVLADLNVSLDDQPPRLTELTVHEVYSRVSRGRRHRRTYYYAYVEPRTATPDKIRSRLQITYETYQSLLGKTSARIAIRPGALGHPWIESITP